jgi:hypothetical protein
MNMAPYILCSALAALGGHPFAAEPRLRRIPKGRLSVDGGAQNRMTFHSEHLLIMNPWLPFLP